MDKLAIIILAAGMGKRMGSQLPKVLTKLGEKTLIEHVLSNIDSLPAERRIVVVGYKGQLVEEQIIKGNKSGSYKANINIATQKEMLGTGDAVKAAIPFLKDFIGTVLILYSDSPLITAKTLNQLLEKHQQTKATITVLSMHVTKENAYGRIVRNKSGHVDKIVEFKDCSEEEKQITETNSGIYAVDSAFLIPALNCLTNNNAQHEYYLTDIVGQAVKEGQIVEADMHKDYTEFLGVNTLEDLEIIKKELAKRNK